MNHPTRFTVTLLFAAASLLGAGCEQRSAGPQRANGSDASKEVRLTTVAASAQEVFVAYETAESDGKFATHLGPFIDPEEVANSEAEIPFRDVDGYQPQPVESRTFEVVPMTAEQIAESSERVDFVVEPTHQLVINTKYPKSGDGVTESTFALSMRQVGDDKYYLVFGIPRTNDRLAEPFPEGGPGYRAAVVDFRHQWNIPIEAGTAAEYHLVIRNTETGEELAELFPGRARRMLFDSPRDEVQAKLATASFVRFSLGNESSDLAESYGQDFQSGESQIKFRASFRVGENGGFVLGAIPGDAVEDVKPNTDVAIDSELPLSLISLVAKNGEERTPCEIVVVRNQ